MRLSARRGKPSGCGAFDTGRRGTRAACSAWAKLRTVPPFDPFIGTSVFRSPRSPNCSAIRLGGPPSIGSTPESRRWRGSEAGAPTVRKGGGDEEGHRQDAMCLAVGGGNDCHSGANPGRGRVEGDLLPRARRLGRAGRPADRRAVLAVRVSGLQPRIPRGAVQARVRRVRATPPREPGLWWPEHADGDRGGALVFVRRGLAARAGGGLLGGASGRG